MQKSARSRFLRICLLQTGKGRFAEGKNGRGTASKAVPVS